MRLLYVYVESFKCLKGRSFHFDAHEVFDVDRDRTENGVVEIKMRKGQTCLPADFWSLRDAEEKVSRTKRGRVESVSGIIGRNGSGKTSLATMFYNVCRPVDDPQGRTPRYVCIYKTGRNYVCMHGNNWKIRTSHLAAEVKKRWKEIVCRERDLPFDFH